MRGGRLLTNRSQPRRRDKRRDGDGGEDEQTSSSAEVRTNLWTAWWGVCLKGTSRWIHLPKWTRSLIFVTVYMSENGPWRWRLNRQNSDAQSLRTTVYELHDGKRRNEGLELVKYLLHDFTLWSPSTPWNYLYSFVLFHRVKTKTTT